MGILQTMEEECDCVEVIFQDYIQSRKTHKIFIFFEGKDDYKYYWCRISTFIGQRQYKKYICNCKNNVILVYEMISTKTKIIKTEKLLYFVDNDFDKDKQISSDIYTTPTYSIENLYVTDNALRNIIRGEWGLSSEMEDQDREDFDCAINYLITKRNEVIDSMIYANAWYSLQCKKAYEKSVYPKLSALKEYHVIKHVNDKSILKELVPNSVDISDNEIGLEKKYLEEKPVERLRGKYFEQTMPYFLMKIIEDSNKKNNRIMFSKRRKVNINVGADNMISILSIYAEVPESLTLYIARKLNDLFDFR